MSDYLSDKFKILSFISIILVIYIHMYYSESQGMEYIMTVERFIGGGIALIAVPLFYFISGYLFFIKVENGLVSIFEKMKKRVRTLFVPYMIANTLTFIFYVLLNAGFSLFPAVANVVNFKILDVISQHSFLEILKIIYWSPIAFQLWFIRDLMLFVLVSPLVYLVLRTVVKYRWAFYLALALCLCTAFYGFHIIWVVIGGLLVMRDDVSVIEYKLRYSPVLVILLTCLFVGLCIFNCVSSLRYISNLIPVVGVISVWSLYDVAVNGNLLCKYKIINCLCQFTFFIYLIHEPLLNIFKKIPLLLSRSEGMMLCSYMITPWIFIVFVVLMGLVLKRTVNCAYLIYTGGR